MAAWTVLILNHQSLADWSLSALSQQPLPDAATIAAAAGAASSECSVCNRQHGWRLRSIDNRTRNACAVLCCVRHFLPPACAAGGRLKAADECSLKFPLQAPVPIVVLKMTWQESGMSTNWCHIHLCCVKPQSHVAVPRRIACVQAAAPQCYVHCYVPWLCPRPILWWSNASVKPEG